MTLDVASVLGIKSSFEVCFTYDLSLAGDTWLCDTRRSPVPKSLSEVFNQVKDTYALIAVPRITARIGSPSFRAVVRRLT